MGYASLSRPKASWGGKANMPLAEDSPQRAAYVQPT